jgi:hypothetical protein
MKKLFCLALCLLIAAGAMAQINLNKVKSALSGSQLSSEDVAKGLKEALTVGVSKGSDLLAQADGYYKNESVRIPFPPEASRAEDKLRRLGMGAEVDKFVIALNRAAEDAAQEAKPIFLTAIQQISIEDGWSILRGPQDAATSYLRLTSSGKLQEKFKPVVQDALNKANAIQLYANLVKAYNRIPMVQKVNPELDDYATQKAIEGLFVIIAFEEKKIRQNPAARTSGLLQKVFGEKK